MLIITSLHIHEMILERENEKAQIASKADCKYGHDNLTNFKLGILCRAQRESNLRRKLHYIIFLEQTSATRRLYSHKLRFSKHPDPS